MALQNINPTSTAAWDAIQEHFETMKAVSMKQMFQDDPSRASKFHIQWNDFLVDYSKNRINQETMDLLVNLANEVHLKEAISAYFSGETINRTEDRAVLHTALRAPENSVVKVDGHNIIPEIYEVKKDGRCHHRD